MAAVTFFPDVSPMDITSAYEGGNGARSVAPIRVSANHFRVHCDPDPVQNWTGHFDVAARSTRLPGRAITFDVMYKYGASSSVSPYVGTAYYTSTTFHPWYTVDGGDTWLPSTSWSFTSAASGQTLTVTGPVLGAGVREYRVAETPPYTWAQYTNDIDAWGRTGYLTKTKLCDTVGEQHLPVYRVTVVGSSAGTRKTICMYRSGHENERFATWRARGMVQWACSTAAAAITFRQRRVLQAIVVMNPDALVNGWMRVTSAGVQTNRWNPAGTPSVPVEGVEQAAVHADLAALAADTPVNFFMDMHSAYSQGGEYLFYRSHSSFATAPLATFDTGGLISHTIGAENYSSSGNSHRIANEQYGAINALWDAGGPYHNNGAATTIASAQALGATVIQAVDAWLVSNG